MIFVVNPRTGTRPTVEPPPPAYCNTTFNAVAVIYQKIYVFSVSTSPINVLSVYSDWMKTKTKPKRNLFPVTISSKLYRKWKEFYNTSSTGFSLSFYLKAPEGVKTPNI